MNDELNCEKCGQVLAYILPMQNRPTAGAFQMPRNFVPLATHSDGRRVFAFVANPRGGKNRREADTHARQKAFDDSYYQTSNEERAELNEMRAEGILRTPDEVRQDEKASRQKRKVITHNIIEVSEFVTGFWVRCNCKTEKLLILQNTTGVFRPQKIRNRP